MTQLPPEHRGGPARSSSDWDAILAGGSSDADVPSWPRPNPPTASAPPQPASPEPAPRTRREAREAEQRRAALLRDQEQAASPSATPPSQEQVTGAPQGHHRHAHAQPAPQWPAEQQAAPQWPAEQQAPPQWQEEQDTRLPWDDAPQPWDGDADDEPLRRLSRAERRSLKHRVHHDDERPRKRGPWGCLIGLVVVIALGAAAFFFLQGPVTAFLERFEPPEDYTGTGTGEVVFMINDGDGGDTIAANLADEGVVASAEAFVDEVTSRTPTPTFFPGAYRLANEMSAKAALDAILDPANKLENTFVIQEGLWARDAFAAASVATGIPIEDLQAAAADPQALGLPTEATSIEGFLFPATYTFPPDVTAQDVVQTLVDRSFEALDEAGVPPERRWETVVIASLIEREAGSEADAYKVSRVIRNRLDPVQFESGLLQFDSTVHYGIGDDSSVETSDAERADPSNIYNTYVHPGLPPGPIGNPGDVAITAALNPADGPWLYFVTVNLETGETVFSATLAEHEAAVERFIQYLDENS